jgi:hypothetical protein
MSSRARANARVEGRVAHPFALCWRRVGSEALALHYHRRLNLVHIHKVGWIVARKAWEQTISLQQSPASCSVTTQFLSILPSMLEQTSFHPASLIAETRKRSVFMRGRFDLTSYDCVELIVSKIKSVSLTVMSSGFEFNFSRRKGTAVRPRSAIGIARPISGGSNLSFPYRNVLFLKRILP